MSLTRGNKSDISMVELKWLSERVQQIADIYDAARKGVFGSGTHGKDIKELRSLLNDINFSEFESRMESTEERIAKLPEDSSTSVYKLTDKSSTKAGQIESHEYHKNDEIKSNFLRLVQLLDSKFDAWFNHADDKTKVEMSTKPEKHHYARMLAMTLGEVAARFSVDAVKIVSFVHLKDVSIARNALSKYNFDNPPEQMLQYQHIPISPSSPAAARTSSVGMFGASNGQYVSLKELDDKIIKMAEKGIYPVSAAPDKPPRPKQ